MTHTHNEDIDESTEERLTWQRPYFILGEKPFVPHIYSGTSNETPEGFNTARICLNGKTDADLDWKKERARAEELTKKGYKILWDLDLGLFENLREPLTNEAQYRALCLALDHFRQGLWKEFHSSTFGLCLYCGSSLFSESFQWDRQQLDNLRGWLKDHFSSAEELSQEIRISIPCTQEVLPSHIATTLIGRQLLEAFCRSACVSYLDLLLGSLPDAAAAFVFLDTSLLQSPLHYAQVVNQELFERFYLGVSHPLFFHEQLGWGYGSPSGYLSDENEQIESLPEITLGICWPTLDIIKPSAFSRLSETLKQLISRNICFRIVPEARLTAEWDGLDDLIVDPTILSGQGKRKLLGFCAAGGTVITLGEIPLNLPQENSFDIFLKDFK